MITVMILMILPTVNSQIKQLPEMAPEWFTKLSNEQKYQYFKKAHEIGVSQYEILQEKIKEDKDEVNDYEAALLIIEDNKKFLNKYKPFYPKYGISGGLQGLLNEGWEVDIIGKVAFYKFFWQGRLFICVEGNVKLYEKRGGGTALNFGILF